MARLPPEKTAAMAKKERRTDFSDTIMKKSRKKWIIIFSIAAAVLILLAFLTMHACSSLAERARVSSEGGAEVQILEPQDLSTAISATGKIESQTVVSAASDLTYRIKELPVQLGDHVEAGQTLCVFDDTELKQEIAELEQVISEAKRLSTKQSEINRRSLEEAKTAQQEALEEAQAAINTAKAQYDLAKSNYDTLGDEYYADFVEAEANYHAAQNAYKQTERSTNETIRSCQDTIDTESASADDATNAKQLAELKRKLEKTTVTAECSGIITSIRVHQGSVHDGGELMTIQDNTKMKVVVSLTETDVVKIKEGMKAEITANALEEETISGTVSKVINFSTGSAESISEEGEMTAAAGYSAEILIDSPGNLLLGMTAKVRILLSELTEALAVSYDSIGYDGDGNAYVFRARPDGDAYRVEKIPVETGAEGDYYTQISSDALSEGDYILYYPDLYSEGDTIDVNPDFLEE